MFKKEYLTIFLIMVTEVLGFSLILPFLPFFAQDLGASPFLIGFIFMTFSLCQFISAPIMGRLSDSYGRKPLLIISQISTFISFIILALANSLWMVFLSRIIDGMFGSNMTIAQAYLADVSSKKDRSKAFSISGAAFGVGFLIGPGIGGYLAQFSFSLPSLVAAGVALLTIILTIIILKETVKNKKKMKISLSLFHFDHLFHYFSQPKIASRLSQLFVYLAAHSIFVSSFALYSERQLDFGPQEVGFVLMGIGIASVIIRMIVLPKLIDSVGEKVLMWIGSGSVVVSMLIAVVVRNPWMFGAGMVIYVFGNSVYGPLATGAISRSVSQNEQGAIMGVTSSLRSLSDIGSPLLGGFLINYFFPGSVPLVAMLLMVCAAILMFRERFIKKAKETV